uniref:Uncharacterized protein n=1 Tax=Romanomermis culicivorax TaxID=13658 RepID=A0A915IAF1_ROMCU
MLKYARKHSKSRNLEVATICIKYKIKKNFSRISEYNYFVTRASPSSPIRTQDLIIGSFNNFCMTSASRDSTKYRLCFKTSITLP